MPFWDQCIRPAEAEGVYLWFLRYAKRGEHLKLRVHGPAPRRAFLEQALSERIEHYFDSLEPVERPGVRLNEGELPPIDLEDRESASPPDHTLLWTRYQRSPATLGPKFLIASDEYSALFTACSGKACGLVLSTLATQGDAGLPFSRRQETLRRLVGSGLEVLFPQAEERWRYVTYHRDWLVRYPLLRAGGREERARQTLARYEGEMKRLRIAPPVASSGIASPREGAMSQREQAWLLSLLDLRHYLTVRVEDAALKLDPFARAPFFPVLFKLFHGVANALGINALNEGLAYHQLLRTAKPASPRMPFSLLPRGSKPRYLHQYETRSQEQEPPFHFERDYRWLDLVAASGPAGSRWAQLYESSAKEALGYSEAGLSRLRERRLAEGLSLLERAESCRRSLIHGPSSISHVVARFYYGTLAYAFYCQSDFERAERALRHAQESIRAALEAEEFLIPFATHSLDVRAKSVLVAREQCQWIKVTRRIHALRAVTLDRKPLSMVSDGNVPIFHSTIVDFISKLPNLTKEIERVAVYLSDKSLRLAECEAGIGAMYALPGFVIPCP